ncbi:MAG: hypothetical protein HYZ42_04225 [Bacteroidetes bacterium]|nr:hypothetical protein [Bacteroidota bacterium]
MIGKVDTKISIDSIKQNKLEYSSTSFVDVSSKKNLVKECLVNEKEKFKPIVIKDYPIQKIASDTLSLEREKRINARLGYLFFSIVFFTATLIFPSYVWLIIGITLILLCCRIISLNKSNLKQSTLLRKVSRGMIALVTIGLAIWTLMAFELI